MRGFEQSSESGHPFGYAPRSGIVKYNSATEIQAPTDFLIESINPAKIRQWTLLQILRFSPEALSFHEICSHFYAFTLDYFSSDTLRKDLAILKEKDWIEMLRKKADGTRMYCYRLTRYAPLLFEKHSNDLAYFCNRYKDDGFSAAWGHTFANVFFKTNTLIFSYSKKFSINNTLQTHNRFSGAHPDPLYQLIQFQKYNYQNCRLKIPYEINSGTEITLYFSVGLIVYSHEKNTFYLLGEVNGHKNILKLANIKSIEKIEETFEPNYIYKSPKYIRIFHEMFSISVEPPQKVVVRFKKLGNTEKRVRALMNLRFNTRPIVDFDYRDDEIRYQDTIRGLKDFARYLHTFGEEALAVKPSSLVEHIQSTSLQMMQAYERLGILDETHKCI